MSAVCLQLILFEEPKKKTKEEVGAAGFEIITQKN